MAQYELSVLHNLHTAKEQLKKDLVRSLVSDLQKDAVWIAAILSDLSDDGMIPSNVSAVMNTIVDGLKKLDSALQTNTKVDN